MSTAKANSTEGRGDSVSDLQPISESLAESVSQELADLAQGTHWTTNYLAGRIKAILLRRIAQPEEIERLKRRCTQLTSRELSALDMLEKEQEKSFKLDSEIDKLQAELAATPSPSEEVYILLKEGDVIQEGDEFFVTRILGWTKASDIGMKIDPRYPYRRKVAEASQPESGEDELLERIRYSQRMHSTNDDHFTAMETIKTLLGYLEELARRVK